MTEQPALFEGYRVERQQASIVFDIESEDERFFTVDQPVIMVIVAHVDVPRFARTRDGGGLKRSNKLNPVVARVADGVMRDELIEMFHLEEPGSALFYSAPSPPLPTPVADEETGEIVRTPVAAQDRRRDPHLDAFLSEPAGLG